MRGRSAPLTGRGAERAGRRDRGCGIGPWQLRNKTKIASHLDSSIKAEVIGCLRRNVDVFAWSSAKLTGIRPM